ncbi:metal-sulfur cluster assembly factor [Devosia honganensis]|uniref:Metal-sulfur cluster assembly factor n=1 Tax=Devosia honganensis TaxID=1610527 RepID=A0ABV7X0Y5_9HYPH
MIDASADMVLEAEVREALREVIDPELGFNIVDLGMIYDIGVTDEGAARVIMTTTVRGCPATDFLRQAVETRTAGVAGIGSVSVELTYDPPWSPMMAAPELAAQF